MKTIMGILLVLVVAFAAVPICAAGTGPAAQGSQLNIGHDATVALPLESTCQGAYHFGPATPVPMGTVGGAAG